MARFLKYLSLILPLGGLFVAGYLAIKYATGGEIACGKSGGCGEVALWVKEHAGDFPVAYVGVFGYVLLLGLGVYGLIKGKPHAKPGLILSGLGLLASVGLMSLSLFVIKAECKWCIASALIMLGTFLTYLGLNNVPLEQEPTKPFEWAGLAVGVVALVVATDKFAITSEAPSDPYPQPVEFFIPEKPKDKGSKSSKVVVIEFFDFTCAHCRKMNEELKDMLDKSKDGFYLVLRNSPLAGPGHEQGPAAALIGEFAHEKGKFWDYYNRAFRVDANSATIQQYIDAAGEIGLNEVEIEKRREDKNDPVVKLWAEDMNLMSKVGISETPMFFVGLRGEKKVDVYTSKQFTKAMREGKYKPYVFK
ncbi:MAG: thioredoxin domain-containing protein [Fimbriimonadaceae bacterium]